MFQHCKLKLCIWEIDLHKPVKDRQLQERLTIIDVLYMFVSSSSNVNTNLDLEQGNRYSADDDNNRYVSFLAGATTAW